MINIYLSKIKEWGNTAIRWHSYIYISQAYMYYKAIVSITSNIIL